MPEDHPVDGSLFDPIFVPEHLREAVNGRAWLGAMLDAERALAVAEARIGLIPRQAAEEIAAHCEAERFDPGEIGVAARATGNPVPPLVKALTKAVSRASEDAARHVHKGATSQGVLDTAAMLVARSALDLILADLPSRGHVLTGSVGSAAEAGPFFVVCPVSRWGSPSGRGTKVPDHHNRHAR